MMCPASKVNNSDWEYYPRECVLRQCSKCANALDSFTCEKCRGARPEISCLQWQPVPYHCKDGRELETHDFVKARLSIDEYLGMVRSHCESFFPHHERAKWQDEDSDFMRKNIHKIGTELNEATGLYECDLELGFCFMSNEDFSQIYTPQSMSMLVDSSTQLALPCIPAFCTCLSVRCCLRRLHPPREEAETAPTVPGS